MSVKLKYLNILCFLFFNLINCNDVKIIELNHTQIDAEMQSEILKTWKAITKNNKDDVLIFDEDRIWVSSNKKNISFLKKTIKKFDQPKKRISIEILTFAATDVFFQNLYINWSGIYNRLSTIMKNNNNFGFVGMGSRLKDIPTPTEPVSAAKGNLYVNPQEFSINLANPLPAPSTFSFPIVFGGPNLNKERLNILITNLEANSKLRNISNPVLIVDNRSIAKVSIGQKLPIYTQIIDTPTGGVPTNLSKLEYIHTGISIQLKPEILNNEDILLDLIIQQPTLLSGSTETLAGLLIKPPNLLLNQTRNKVILKNNQATFISIFTEKDDQEGATQVPLISKMPLLKKIFKSNAYAKEHINVYVMITCNFLN